MELKCLVEKLSREALTTVIQLEYEIKTTRIRAFPTLVPGHSDRLVVTREPIPVEPEFEAKVRGCNNDVNVKLQMVERHAFTIPGSPILIQHHLVLLDSCEVAFDYA